MKLLYFWVLLISCIRSDEAFLDKVLSDFRSSSYFLSFELDSPNMKGRVLIQNIELYYFLKKTRRIDRDSYKKYVKSLLKEDKVSLEETDLSNWGFILVSQELKINSYAKEGIDPFIKQFFNRGIIKDGLSNKEWYSIISWLCEWKILSYIDDESGYLVVETN